MWCSPRSLLPTLALGLAALVSLASAPIARAQCFGNDGLDLGGCCAPVVPNLPLFQQGTLPALGICWQNCVVGAQTSLVASWSPPFQTSCTQYGAQFSVTDAGGIPVLSGMLVLDYTRTWQEVDPSGNLHQVWRFAVKADLSPVLVGIIPPCPVPTCVAPFGPHPTAFYYGYMDFARGCSATSTWQNSLVLYHACDFFIHNPGLSDRPGVFHPGRSYAIVAPHTTVQPFIPMNQPAPGGPLVAEAVRNVGMPGLICMAEDRVVSGVLQPLGGACLCPLAPAPKQHTLRNFTGKTGCIDPVGLNGNWQTLNIGFPGTLPWFHDVTTSIGVWANNAVYPGKESAWVDEGLYIHHDVCQGSFVEIKYGGTTRDGWTPLLSVPLPVKSFTDVADNYTAPLTGPYPFPILGSVRPTDRLIYVNTP